MQETAVSGAALPESIVHHVMHTRESVILDDASIRNPFFTDAYISQRQVHSLLCLPLINQGKLTGVLYLENNLVSRAFTPNQITVLKVIASQAAISLENARLYHDLEERERRYRQVQMELARANRVVTMGQLSASIAHEVNQPIAAAVTDAQSALRFLAAQPPDLEEVRDALECIVKSGNRASDIINRIRALMNRTPPQKEWLAINEVILEVSALARAEVMKNGASMQTQLAEGLPLVKGDRVQLQQVILNLIINAVDAMSSARESDRELIICTDRAKLSGVLVAVKDSGPGLDPGDLERAFEAFYTTKPGGLGMGLSICRSIIEAHGGQLWASTNVPRGAIFQFTMPA